MNLTRLAYEFCRMKKCPRFIHLSFISEIDEKAIYAYKGMENWPRQAHSDQGLASVEGLRSFAVMAKVSWMVLARVSAYSSSCSSVGSRVS